jgi:hypothetical protein
MTVSDLLGQPCNKSDNAIKLFTSGNKQAVQLCKHNSSTACEQICDNLFADM